MLKRALTLVLALTAFALVTGIASAKELSLGDSAPTLAVKKFVKGAPVTKFEKGKLYVVEFWATWCPPCRESIPHLTEMAKKYKDVTFIGVSVFENSQADVAPFVEKMGAKMDYHVAIDDVPAGSDAQRGQNGQMAVNWMQAAGQDGIPTAFIVDKESKVAWIGHPMSMEKPLGMVVAGTWDMAKAKAEAAKAKAQAAAMKELQAKLSPALQAKDFEGALKIVNDAINHNTDMEQELGTLKFSLLSELGKDDEAAAYGEKLIAGGLKDDAQTLNAISWQIVDPARPKKAADPLVKMALKAALRADEVSKSKDGAVADTLAAAYFANGNVDKAIESEQRAIDLAKGTPLEKDPSLTRALAKYKAAKK